MFAVGLNCELKEFLHLKSLQFSNLHRKLEVYIFLFDSLFPTQFDKFNKFKKIKNTDNF